MRYRKNIDCLSADELHDLREAYAGIYALAASNPDSFAVLASLHGGPPTAYCRHGAPGFLTWHRPYMLAFEDALRSVRCHVTLPFWDWSSGPSTGVPEACRHPTYVNRSGATVANPLYSGPRAAGGQTSRRADIDTTSFDDIAITAQSALAAATFDSFQNLMNGAHGSVHGRTGGDMGSVPTAAYDPIFYLHHANVDRLWADWQASHPGPLPAGEARLELVPFTRPFSNQWQRGSDVESTSALGYRYRRFCFVLPPIRLWEVAVIDWPWIIRQQMRSARLLIRSTAMQKASLDIRAFVDEPEAGAGTKTAGSAAFAGVAGFFGHGDAARPAHAHDECKQCAELGHTREHAQHHAHGHTHEHDQPRPAVQERFDLEIDLTHAVRSASRASEKLSLKLVAVDPHGRQVPAAEVAVDDIELVVE